MNAKNFFTKEQKQQIVQAIRDAEKDTSGEIRLHSIQILIDHFNFNAFDTNAFSMSQWRSWTVDEFGFLKP